MSENLQGEAAQEQRLREEPTSNEADVALGSDQVLPEETREQPVQSDVKKSKGDFWRSLVREHADSGLTIRDFCKSRGVSCGSFHRWKNAILHAHDASGCVKQTADKFADGNSDESKTPTSKPDDSPRFAEVRLTDVASEAKAGAMVQTSALRISRGDFTLHVRKDCDRALLRDVLGMLGGGAC
jgi:hypothetical protein